ncbi:alpha/beta hydrolase [Nakamurella endophytica]|nr:alpha/beta fold hydrolase [Nakamurella endophytica]
MPRAAGTALRVVLVVVVLLAVLLALLWILQRRLVFPADRSPVPPARTLVPGAADVTLTTDDGLALGAWYVAPREGCGTAVLVAPGNGGNRSGRAPLLRALSAAGLGVLLLDYRGYGGNPGAPSESGLAADALAARRFLAGRGFADADLVYLGESLGGAVVTELAARHPPRALVLRSPFTDLAAVAADAYPFLPVRLLLRDRFPLLATVRGIGVPVTVVLGTRDTLVDPAQSREVAAAAPDGTLVEVAGAGHDDPVLADGPALVRAVADAAGCGES